MKILTDSMNWIDVEFDIKTGRIKRAGLEVKETDIVSIKDDERKKYLRCSHCGEIIRNTKSAKESHLNKSLTSDTCFNCNCLTQRNETVTNKKYKLLSDGSYEVVKKSTCQLVCSKTWTYPNIQSEAARSVCRYSGCKEFTKFEDTFTKYPGLFDDLITVDALDPKKWRFIEIFNGSSEFKVKSRVRVYAIANDKGIIKYFEYRKGNLSSKFRYSLKYNRIFWIDNRTYKTSLYWIPSSIETEIFNIVSATYKEVKK